jgi:hypothetical protein
MKHTIRLKYIRMSLDWCELMTYDCRMMNMNTKTLVDALQSVVAGLAGLAPLAILLVGHFYRAS